MRFGAVPSLREIKRPENLQARLGVYRMVSFDRLERDSPRPNAVSTCLFFYPKRVADPGAYMKHFQKYVRGLHTLVHRVNSAMPEYRILLYVDAPSILPKKDSGDKEKQRLCTSIVKLRERFPDILTVIWVAAAAPFTRFCRGKPTFLPSIWRYLALFDPWVPRDVRVLWMSELDAPSIQMDWPSSDLVWDKSRQAAMFVRLSTYRPEQCVLGETLTQDNGVSFCPSAGISAFVRQSQDAFLDVGIWEAMTAFVTDVKLRAVVKDFCENPTKSIVGDELAKAVDCGESLLESIAQHPAAAVYRDCRSCLRFLRLLFFRTCDSMYDATQQEWQSQNYREVLAKFEDILLRFGYGIDEFLMHVMFQEFTNRGIRFYLCDDSRFGDAFKNVRAFGQIRLGAFGEPAELWQLSRALQTATPYQWIVDNEMTHAFVDLLSLEWPLRIALFDYITFRARDNPSVDMARVRRIVRQQIAWFCAVFSQALSRLGITEQQVADIILIKLSRGNAAFMAACYRKIFRIADASRPVQVERRDDITWSSKNVAEVRCRSSNAMAFFAAHVFDVLFVRFFIPWMNLAKTKVDDYSRCFKIASEIPPK